MPLTAQDLAHATEVVARSMGPTPQYVWPLLSAAVGAQVWVKHENATPTGAFKVRGGLVYVERLRRDRPQVQGIVSATRGNHGQSLAFAGRAHDLPVVIVVPEGNSPDKNAAMIGFGAELVVHGEDFEAARRHSLEVARERGYEAVPPFHPDLVAGVATYAAELFAAAGPLDAVFAPVGMGSGVNALIGVRDLMGLPTEVFAVAAAEAPATALSFRARAVTEAPAATFADGVACRRPDPGALAGLLAGAADVLTVTEDEIADAMRLHFRTTHQLSCPSGALGLAGLWQQRHRWAGRRVAVVQTSSNIDADLAVTVLTGGTPTTG